MFAKDKQLHFLACFLIAFIGGVITGRYIAAFGLTIVIGIAKEIVDYYSKEGTAEFMDIVADILGGIVGIGLAFTVRYVASILVKNFS